MGMHCHQVCGKFRLIFCFQHSTILLVPLPMDFVHRPLHHGLSLAIYKMNSISLLADSQNETKNDETGSSPDDD